jgi:hypothetical protein
MSCCRRCGRPIPPRDGRRGAERFYCSNQCRKRWAEEHDPDDRVDEVSILVRERLEHATWSTATCRCEWPLSALDEDDAWRCVKCARPLASTTEMPPAA